MNVDELIQEAERRWLGNVVEILHEATILHEGWEMDNRGWIVKLEGGEVRALTTSHGGPYLWTKEELEGQIEVTRRSLDSLLKAQTFAKAFEN
jgi:hypothetical protein